MFRKYFERINSSKITVMAFLFVMFLGMFYLNSRTPLTCDDFCYAFSWDTGERITSVGQIFGSMLAHRLSMNGRLVAHFMVQMFIMLPKVIFNVLNSAMFVALIYLIYSAKFILDAPGSKRHDNALIIVMVFCAIWLLNPAFGQVYFWLDGSINYLWGEVFALLWLIPQFKCYNDRSKKLSVPFQVFYLIASLFMGAYSENTTPALVFMALLIIGLKLFFRKEKPECWRIISIILMFIGFLLMVSAPGELSTKSKTPGLAEFLYVVLDLTKSALAFWPVFLSFVLLLLMSLRLHRDDVERRLVACIWMLGSLASNYILFFASGGPWRSFAIVLVLAIPGCIILLDSLFETAVRYIAYAVCVASVCATMYWGLLAVKDISTVFYKFNYNEQLIAEQIASGETDIHVPFITPKTKYSSFSGLYYLHPYSGNWLNVGVAKYYGVDAMIGYDLYE